MDGYFKAKELIENSRKQANEADKVAKKTKALKAKVDKLMKQSKSNNGKGKTALSNIQAAVSKAKEANQKE